MQNDLPPEFNSLLSALANEPEHVRAMWRYTLVLMMIDNEKAQVMGTRLEDGHNYIAVRTVAGDEFEIEHPAMSEETEKLLLQQIREIVADEQDEH